MGKVWNENLAQQPPLWVFPTFWVSPPPICFSRKEEKRLKVVSSNVASRSRTLWMQPSIPKAEQRGSHTLHCMYLSTGVMYVTRACFCVHSCIAHVFILSELNQQTLKCSIQIVHTAVSTLSIMWLLLCAYQSTICAHCTWIVHE